MLTKIKAISATIALMSCTFATASAQQDSSFSTPAGQTINLSSDRGKVVVLLFSGIQDPQNREGLKALADLAERYRGKEVRFYWVSVNSATEMTNDQLMKFAGNASSVSVVRDINQAAFRRFSGKRAQLPTIVVLDLQGNPFGQPRGGFNPNSDFINDLASMIDRLLQR